MDDNEWPSKPKRQKKEPRTIVCQLLVALCLCLLVVVAIVGPIIAFTVVSCTSTGSCRIVGLLGLQGAKCTEGTGSRSEYLMHGEECTLQCSNGFTPSVSKLKCNDGVTEGGDHFKCLVPAPAPPTGPLVGGLISGAITGGELRTACDRARSLKCQGIQGSTAILFQWPSLTQVQCKEQFDKCRGWNPEFEIMQFFVNTATTTTPASIFVHQPPAQGTCTLGCYNEVPVASNPPTLPPIQTPSYLGPAPAPGGDLCGGLVTPTMPICIRVSGSCNVGDNGDYYRQRPCASGLPQWVRFDDGRRIRYDDIPTQSQGGKWLIEAGFVTSSGAFGQFIARQNTFNDRPVLGSYPWSVECITSVNFLQSIFAYRTISIDLGTCSCTRNGDCSGNGDAVGSKTNGPHCSCQCDTGYSGTNCQTRLCKAPQIFQGANPACAEGQWIQPNGICTTQCTTGYTPSIAQLVCSANGGTFTPNIFMCRGSLASQASLAQQASAQYAGTTTTPAVCAAIDCSYRGTPTGQRHSDGTCVCTCNANWVGNNCRTYSGSCRAPDNIENAHPDGACAEGKAIASTCTAQCAPGYWPVPDKLTCQAVTDVLAPTVFTCFGGPPVSETWCKLMKYFTIGASCLAACILLIICVYEAPVLKRKPEAFVLGDSDAVELDKDDHGHHYVIRCAGKIEGSKLPERIRMKEIHGPLQSGTSHLDHTSDEGLRVQIQRDRDAGIAHTLLGVTSAHALQDAPVKPLGSTAPSVAESEASFGLRALASNAVPNSALDSLAILSEAHEADLESSSEDSHLQPDYGGQLALGLPGSVPPEEVQPLNEAWVLQFRALEEDCQRKRYEETKNAAAETLTLEQKAAIERANAIAKTVEDTVQERMDAEDAIEDAMAAGDGNALREAVKTGNALLVKLDGAAASVTNALTRLLKLGEGRLQQFEEKESKRKARDGWLGRIQRGDAADWHMTVQELWQHAEAGNGCAVRAGLKAKLPVLNRSPDGTRLTVLHVACRPACVEVMQAAAARAAAQAAAAAAKAAAEEAAAALAAAQIPANGTPPGSPPATAQAAQGAGGALGVGSSAAGVEKQTGSDSGSDVLGAADAGAGPVQAAPQQPAEDLPAAAASPVCAEEGKSLEVEGGEKPVTLGDEDDLEDDPSLPSVEDVERRRLEVIEALLKSHAIPNTVDFQNRTPLDLALEEGGPGSEELPITQKLRALGLLTAKEAGEKARVEAEEALFAKAAAKVKAASKRAAGRR